MTSKTFVSGTVVDSAWLNDVNNTIYYGEVNVKRYGAVGDGSTDDTAAINTALATGAGTVRLGDGTFIVSSLAPSANQRIVGNGPKTILKQKASSANFTRVILINLVNNVIVENLQIDGNGANVTAGEQNHGIMVAEASGAVIRNCIIHDCQGDAVSLYSNTDPVSLLKANVSNNYIYNLGRSGIVVSGKGARGVTITNNQIVTGTYVPTSTSHGNAIHLELDTAATNYIGDIYVAGNLCEGTGITSSGNFTGLVITGNTVRNVNQAVSVSHIAVVNPADVVISNNTLLGDNTTILDGISIQDSGNAGTNTIKSIVVQGNIIEKVAGHGINILGTGTGIPSIGTVSIIGNICRSIGTGSTKNGILVATNYPDTLIANNNINTVTNIGIAVLGCVDFSVVNNKIAECTASYGIYVDASAGVAGPGIISGNTIKWATVAGKTGVRIENTAGITRIGILNNDLAKTASPYSIGAAAVKCFAVGNIQGNDAPSGSFTLAAAASKVVTNSNVTVDTKVMFFPTNAAAATLMQGTKSLYVSARTAQTSFTITTADATAAGGTETFEYVLI